MADVKSDRKDLPDKNPVHHCSFCGCSQNEVNELILGPAVYICDDCVFEFAGIFVEECEGPFETDTDTVRLLKNLRYLHKVRPEAFLMACAYLKGVSDTVRYKQIDESM